MERIKLPTVAFEAMCGGGFGQAKESRNQTTVKLEGEPTKPSSIRIKRNCKLLIWNYPFMHLRRLHLAALGKVGGTHDRMLIVELIVLLNAPWLLPRVRLFSLEMFDKYKHSKSKQR